ncbi:putative cation exchanger C3A12.06c [Grifola frondosa]|uniref:Putative cation exchanger C3A12.06c n=1 Tax=Grifola frondosa TaxID=5627 RepID=A0A1C7M5R1_GRIFR|nr:putative cation exchanger C3A12.06c [Grifola frondosa]
MALTLTLPVVVTSYEDMSASEKKISGIDNRLIDFEEEGVERALIAEEEISEEMHELKFNKWLMAVQCTLGPLFCVAVLFDGMKQESWLLLATGVTGFTCGILVAVFADKGTHPSAQLARCSMGFTVAVVWIMAIADEVVQVLQTFGFIFGLSDAIIGITIFAVGNSLADLVANMSVAVFAPIMGFSACFGGPMLNILLGVGISGSYIIRKTGYPYPLHFSTSLVITGTGLLAFLLATLVFVPWNGYFLPRSWGFALIAAYVALMAANIVVEAQS